MKYLLAGCFAFLALFAPQNTPAYADNDKLDFSLVNKTGYGIKEVYIGPHIRMYGARTSLMTRLKTGRR